MAGRAGAAGSVWTIALEIFEFDVSSSTSTPENYIVSFSEGDGEAVDVCFAACAVFGRLAVPVLLPQYRSTLHQQTILNLIPHRDIIVNLNTRKSVVCAVSSFIAFPKCHRHGFVSSARHQTPSDQC